MKQGQGCADRAVRQLPSRVGDIGVSLLTSRDQLKGFDRIGSRRAGRLGAHYSTVRAGADRGGLPVPTSSRRSSLAVAALAFICLLQLAPEVLATAGDPLPTEPAVALADSLAPFTLPDQAGHEVALAALWDRGPVVLYLYPMDFTPGCTREAAEFERLHASFDSLKTTVLGLSVDDGSSHARFAESCGVGFPLLADTTANVVRALGAAQEIETRNGKRTIARRHTYLLGPGGVIWKHWTEVNPAVHADEVLAELKRQIAR